MKEVKLPVFHHMTHKIISALWEIGAKFRFKHRFSLRVVSSLHVDIIDSRCQFNNLRSSLFLTGVIHEASPAFEGTHLSESQLLKLSMVLHNHFP